MEQPAANYPDILGYITAGQCVQIACVEVALSVRPQVIRAGRTMELVVLIQNQADSRVNVTAQPILPQQDAEGKPGRFLADEVALSVALRPAEVGYMLLPVSTDEDTAIHSAYAIGARVDVNVIGSDYRLIRQRDEAAESPNQYYFYLNGDTVNHLVELKSLEFSVETPTEDENVMMTEVSLISAREEVHDNPAARWVSLWAMGDHTDVRPSLERYGGVLRSTILPQLNRQTLFAPLFQATQNRLLGAGYAAQPAEVHFVVKLLISILEMATQPGPLRQDDIGDEAYYVAFLLKQGWSTDGSPIPLPNWCRVMLHTMGFDTEIVQNPVRALTGALYDDLLRDAILHGFKLLFTATGEELGTEDDMHAYADQLIQAMWHPHRNLTFVDVYLPLVLGGILVDERVILPYENTLKFLHTLRDIVEQQTAETESDALIITMAQNLIEKALAKYGYHL